MDDVSTRTESTLTDAPDTLTVDDAREMIAEYLADHLDGFRSVAAEAKQMTNIKSDKFDERTLPPKRTDRYTWVVTVVGSSGAYSATMRNSDKIPPADMIDELVERLEEKIIRAHKEAWVMDETAPSVTYPGLDKDLDAAREGL